MSGENHENRRRWIIATAVGLIAREGLEAVTFRRIARELGFSTTAVTYYFADKSELLLEAFGSFKAGGARSFRARYARDPRDLLGHLVAITTAEGEGLDVSRCFHAFRGLALNDARFGDEHRRYFARCQGYIRAFATAALPPSVDPERASRRLMSIVEGISSQRVLAPDSWSPGDVRDEFAEVLQTLPGARPGEAAK